MRARKVRGKTPTEARLPASRKAGPVAKPTPKTEEEARLAVIRALCGHNSEASTSLALDLRELEQQSPQAYDGVVRGLANAGYLLGHLVERGSAYTRNIAKTVMAYRRQIIRELEITTAAEFMLLDAAMDAYIHWVEVSSLVRLSFKDGTADSKAKFQARLGGMAQSYLRTQLTRIINRAQG